MNIVFLCGSIEPGCDGVGDYTQSLANELIKDGFLVSILSLNDPFITTNLKSEMANGLHTYRIPALLSKKDRFGLAKAWIAEVDPQLVSIQFVIYSYHHKGLPWGVGNDLKYIIGSRRCHIMFHELWIGFTKISSLKHKMYGFFQKRIIKSIITAVHVKAISTTNKLYQLLLEELNVEAKILPLFSNIGAVPEDPAFKAEILSKLHEINNPDSWIFSGIFGNLYPQAKLESAIEEQYVIAKDRNKKIAFIGIGKMNSEGYAEFKRLEGVFNKKVAFLHLGEQPAEIVSNFLHLLDIGFSCTPTQHIGKSGVFASMKLHGVQVILPTAEFIPEYHNEIDEYQQELVIRPAYMWSVSYVAKKFIKIIDPLLTKTKIHVRN